MAGKLTRRAALTGVVAAGLAATTRAAASEAASTSGEAIVVGTLTAITPRGALVATEEGREVAVAFDASTRLWHDAPVTAAAFPVGVAVVVIGDERNGQIVARAIEDLYERVDAVVRRGRREVLETSAGLVKFVPETRLFSDSTLVVADIDNFGLGTRISALGRRDPDGDFVALRIAVGGQTS